MTDTSSAVVWSAEYQPFGLVTVDTASTVENNLRFPGQYFDAETGFHYNWHRYYDPETGRYLTPDPIGLDGGINPYSYVRGNPINFVDPTGLIGLCEIATTLIPFPKEIPFIGDWICAPETSNIYPIDCALMFSDDNGETKECYYECSDEMNGWRVISIDKCSTCPQSMRFDRNSFGDPLSHQ